MERRLFVVPAAFVFVGWLLFLPAVVFVKACHLDFFEAPVLFDVLRNILVPHMESEVLVFLAVGRFLAPFAN